MILNPVSRFSNGWKKPYFMQTYARQERELQIAKRAMRIALNKTQGSPKMQSYVEQGLEWLTAYDGNPRTTIKKLSGQVKRSLRHPYFRPILESNAHDKAILNERIDPNHHLKNYQRLIESL